MTRKEWSVLRSTDTRATVRRIVGNNGVVVRAWKNGDGDRFSDVRYRACRPHSNKPAAKRTVTITYQQEMIYGDWTDMCVDAGYEPTPACPYYGDWSMSYPVGLEPAATVYDKRHW